ncbi:phage associated protein, partial [mine drainage metagenome]
MTTAARYAIIRFLPYAQTEEFANVGVVLHASATGAFIFRLNPKWRRIGAFFDT